jgi:hypothetical protein
MTIILTITTITTTIIISTTTTCVTRGVSSVYFDVGLVVADSAIEFNKGIVPICLPVRPVDAPDYLTGDLVVSTHWGQIQREAGNRYKSVADLKFINLKAKSMK